VRTATARQTPEMSNCIRRSKNRWPEATLDRRVDESWPKITAHGESSLTDAERQYAEGSQPAV